VLLLLLLLLLKLEAQQQVRCLTDQRLQAQQRRWPLPSLPMTCCQHHQHQHHLQGSRVH